MPGVPSVSVVARATPSSSSGSNSTAVESQAVVPNATHHAHDAIVYELRESESLPTIDCSRCLKDALLPPRWLKRYNYLIYHHGTALAVAYAIGCGSGWTFWAVDATTGQWLSVVTVLAHALPLLTTLLLLRYDMVRLLLGTYEFWYLTLSNTVASSFVCATFADWRVGGTLASAIGYEFVMLLDANYRGTRGAVVFTAMAILDVLAFITFAALRLFDRATTPRLFRYNGWTLEAADIIVNGFSTIVLLLLRNAYRKHRAVRQHDHRATTVRCITYKCRVRFVQMRAASAIDATRAASVRPTTTQGDDAVATLSELKFVSFGRHFDASDIIARHFLRQRATRTRNALRDRIAPRLLRALAVSGVALTAASFTSIARSTATSAALPIAALVTTALHCLIAVAHFQRGLVRLLLSSFDVWFLSLQLSLAHLALAHLFHWRTAYVLPLICSWLWSHWVLTLDALTPVVKTKLGVSMRLASAVVVLLLVGLVLLCVEIVVLTNWGITDIVITTVTIRNKPIQMRVAPMLFSRVFTVFAWCWRLLWRLWTQCEDGLLMLQGSVEYEDMELRRRLRARAARKKLTRRPATASFGAVIPAWPVRASRNVARSFSVTQQDEDRA